MKAAFYKGTHGGLAGIYNRLVRWWTRGEYSHAEIVFSGGICASASWMDGGVRFKYVQFDDGKWDFVDLPDHLEHAAYTWFVTNEGKAYDLLGNIRFVFGFLASGKDKYFCSEAIAAALGMPDPWRYEPNVLASALQSFNHQPAPAGFLFTSPV